VRTKGGAGPLPGLMGVSWGLMGGLMGVSCLLKRVVVIAPPPSLWGWIEASWESR
jgi:hypothetical protein